jgi:hypothetical protein
MSEAERALLIAVTEWIVKRHDSEEWCWETIRMGELLEAVKNESPV